MSIHRWPWSRSGGEKQDARRRLVALFAWGLFLAAPAHADVFAFVAEDGTQQFSDQPSDTRYRLYLRSGERAAAQAAQPSPSARRRAAVPRHEAEISAAARASGIEPALLHALVEVESGYDAEAISPKGAQGLTQLMPDTARHYGVTNPFDAAQNLRAGARHLRNLLDLFSGNKELALAAYNAGAGAVLAHGRRIPPYVETVRYVPAVLRNYELLLDKAITPVN